jgi:hypothetical protein
MYIGYSGGNTVYDFYNGSSRISLNAVTINTGTWYNVAFVRSGGNITVYHNGTSVATGSSWTAAVDWGTYSAEIAKYSTYYLNGWIDELRISNTARYTANFTPSTTPFVDDSDTVLLLHMDGTDASTVFTDDNGIGRSQRGITAIGNAQVSTAQSKFGGSSALFDGSGDKLFITPNGNFAYAGDFTVEAWVRPASFSNAQVMFSQGSAEASMIAVYLDSSTGQIIYYAYSGARITSGTNATLNTWQHIAVSRSGSSIKLFKDGTQIGSTYTDTTSIVDATFNIGTWINDTSGWNGHIDEFRISSSARYTSNFTPSTTAFVNDANTLLLVHADGTNASTVFTDDNAQLTATPAAASVDEGSSLTFNVSTINTADQTLYYTLTNSGDFATSSGSFGLATNAGSFAVTPTADSTTEGAETFTASVRTGSTSGPIIATTSAVTINDTSVASVPAVAFDGTGDYYEVTVGSSSGVADSLYTTFAGLIYKNTTGEHNLIQIQLGTASGNNGFNVSSWTNGGILINQPDNSGSDTSTLYGNAGSVGSWYQFVLYVDWSNFANCKYFLNGADVTTASLLNGPSYGDRGVDNSPMNWTSATQCKINIGGFFTYAGARDGSDYNGKIQYLLVKAGAGAPTIANYWDSAAGKPKNLGTDGNATGLAPNVYHYGNTSTFAVNNASAKFATYTLTKYGNTSDTSGTPYA